MAILKWSLLSGAVCTRDPGMAGQLHVACSYDPGTEWVEERARLELLSPSLLASMFTILSQVLPHRGDLSKTPFRMLT